MPRRDGMGPMGMGPMTGRGFGVCGNKFYGRRNCYGPGYGAVYGYGPGNFRQDMTEKEFLKNKKEFLEAQIELIERELEDLKDD